MICGMMVLEDVTVHWRCLGEQEGEVDDVEVTVSDALGGETKSFSMPSKAFAASMALAIDPLFSEKAPEQAVTLQGWLYDRCEEYMPKGNLRWIP